MTNLMVGDKAPDFTGLDQNGKEISLADYNGKKLVLFFYPKDMTPGCTNEVCNLRDNYKLLQDNGFEILGVSADSDVRHKKFIKKHDLPFPLIADVNKNIINNYGIWGPKKFMGREYDGIHRTTFVINENGIIANLFTKVKTKAHAEQILEG